MWLPTLSLADTLTVLNSLWLTLSLADTLRLWHLHSITLLLNDIFTVQHTQNSHQIILFQAESNNIIGWHNKLLTLSLFTIMSGNKDSTRKISKNASFPSTFFSDFCHALPQKRHFKQTSKRFINRSIFLNVILFWILLWVLENIYPEQTFRIYIVITNCFKSLPDTLRQWHLHSITLLLIDILTVQHSQYSSQIIL